MVAAKNWETKFEGGTAMTQIFSMISGEWTRNERPTAHITHFRWIMLALGRYPMRNARSGK